MLAEAGASIERFFASGVLELKEKLGPINWQFLPTKQFDPADFEAFLKLLPKSVEGTRLRHVVEVRHDSFRTPEFVALLREIRRRHRLRGQGGVSADARPDRAIRLRSPAALRRSRWRPATRRLRWTNGRRGRGPGRRAVRPSDLPVRRRAEHKPPKSRDVFIYMINGFKPKAPAAAMALIERVSAARGESFCEGSEWQVVDHVDRHLCGRSLD